ncbi:head maturation protease, ClpP-related [Bordetella flabilis]|uniref:ATP-dependent Clp protease proteolytic subunit n=1 Tax=Bordetella flabilis TaxID=463014 RepID=A0A193GHK5_9BORD|nr:head maturation protease, ClpP-related [Bordetella flabilis]ANN78916.1 peptidase [Bordetella flabilis]
MKITRLPGLPEAAMRPGVHCEISEQVLARWNPSIQAADATTDNTISVLDVIGQDYWTGEGVTSKRIAAALRTIGADKPVTVNVNSPGGDMFEGVAIYNMLRAHKGEVTVRILGMAASAASIIAMAGDIIEIGRPSFFMIHNAWIVAIGNRNDLRDAAEWLEPFDRAMADVYVARTGQDIGTIQAMMDKETWIGGNDAVDRGFADSLLDTEEIQESSSTRAQAHAAARRLDVALAKAGMPRTERRKLLQEIKSGMPGATETGTRDAANPAAALAAPMADLELAMARLRLAATLRP